MTNSPLLTVETMHSDTVGFCTGQSLKTAYSDFRSALAPAAPTSSAKAQTAPTMPSARTRAAASDLGDRLLRSARRLAVSLMTTCVMSHSLSRDVHIDVLGAVGRRQPVVRSLPPRTLRAPTIGSAHQYMNLWLTRAAQREAGSWPSCVHHHHLAPGHA